MSRRLSRGHGTEVDAAGGAVGIRGSCQQVEGTDFAASRGRLPGHRCHRDAQGRLEAVEEFIAADEPRTRAVDGQRAQLSPKYAYNRAIQLRRFAGTFPNTAVCELGKTHLDAFMGSLGTFSSKSRNHHRQAVRQFLQWCVRKDFLASTHRMGEADTMRPEHANGAEVLFYTPKEFAQLLEAADESMRAVIAIGGLAGLRTAELLRLDWADVWRVPGHVEVTSSKSKTRQRRLVEVRPALASWLKPFRAFTTGKLSSLTERAFQRGFRELCELTKVPRKTNGLRHAFCSFHYALHSNENQTAAQAGNSPAMVHSNYKGLSCANGPQRFRTRQRPRLHFAFPWQAVHSANLGVLSCVVRDNPCGQSLPRGEPQQPTRGHELNAFKRDVAKFGERGHVFVSRHFKRRPLIALRRLPSFLVFRLGAWWTWR